MSLLYVLVIIPAIIFLVSKWYLERNRYKKHLERFPGPQPLPIIGNALEFSSSKDLLPKFEKFRQEYGDIVKVSIGPTYRLLITDYKFLEYVLSSTKILDKSATYKFLNNWLGTGLLPSDGDAKWRHHRKIIAPTFHIKVLEEFVAVFQSVSAVLVQKLRNEVGKDSVDVCPYISLCTLDIICETAMGTSVDAQDYSDSEYVQSVKAMCKIIVDRAFNPLLHSKLLYFFSKQYRIERRAVKVLHNYTNLVIANRKENQGSEPSVWYINPADQYGRRRKMAFLDLLLKEKSKGELITDEDIREEVDTFMFAGHDTTASALSFAFHCLASHPFVQRKVVEELREIFNNSWTRPVTYQDLQEMKYLEAVIKEVLRLYPPVPFYARNVREDIEYDGTILPKGLTLHINAYGIHRNPSLFPNPHGFDPERFIFTNLSGQLPYGYIPFSAGPRNCIGQKFAMLEMKTVLSTVLRYFELLPTVPAHEPAIVAETVLKSENGICLRLVNRQR